MFVVFFRAVILYAVVVMALRIMGKKQLGELQPSELVITILVSNIATLPIEDINLPMMTGVVPILTLVCLDVLMSTVTLKSKKIRQIVSGTPKVIISDGVINQKALKKLRYTLDDVAESLRSEGIFDFEEVQYAIVETTGKISALQKFEERPCTAKMMKIEGRGKNPPQIIIDGGAIVNESLEHLKLSHIWLESVLKENKVDKKDVFLLSAYENGDYKLIKKDGI